MRLTVNASFNAEPLCASGEEVEGKEQQDKMNALPPQLHVHKRKEEPWFPRRDM